MNDSDVHIIIFAAGQGKRLKPITDKTPKPLINVYGRPLIYYILDEVKKLFSNNISIVVKYKKEMMKEFLKGYYLSFLEFEEEESGGVAYELLYATKKIPESTIVCLNGDTLILHNSIHKTYLEHNKVGSDATIHLSFGGCLRKQRKYEIDNSRLVNLSKEYNNFTYGRIVYVFNKESLDSFQDNLEYFKKGDEEYGDGWNFLLKQMLNQDKYIHVVKSNDPFVNVNNFEDLNRALYFVRNYLN
jgi:NDP-sugar pyrophosphorylase family protein